MFVKNISPKTIGFGSEHIVPGGVGELPALYDKGKNGKNHPTVQYYIDRGWLKVVDKSPKEVTDDAGTKLRADEEIKELAKMNLDSLKKKAIALGLEVADGDTKEILRNKITEKLRVG